MKRGLIIGIVVVVILAVVLIVMYYPSSPEPSPSECASGGEVTGNMVTGEFRECCEGLEAIAGCTLSEGMTCEDYNLIDGCNSICSNCGNGLCEEIENKCSCPEDCE